MPNLIGMDENQASQAFKNAGFTGNLRITKVTTTDPSKPINRIYLQNFDPDTELDKNTSDVSVEIAIPPQQNQPTTSPSAQPTSTKAPTASPTPSKTG